MTTKLHDHLSYPPRARQLNQPTQAQIEAARKEIASRLQSSPHEDEIVTEATISALTAAAEAGLSDEDKWQIEKEIMLRQRHTIERCARVAESYIGYISAPSPKTIAAAIRALKDA